MMRTASANFKRLRRTAAFTAVALAMPFVATKAVHIAFERPLLDSADVAMVSVLFGVGLLLFATLGIAGAAREFDPPDRPSGPR